MSCVYVIHFQNAGIELRPALAAAEPHLKSRYFFRRVLSFYFNNEFVHFRVGAPKIIATKKQSPLEQPWDLQIMSLKGYCSAAVLQYAQLSEAVLCDYAYILCQCR
jgi:hypothetical protein